MKPNKTDIKKLQDRIETMHPKYSQGASEKEMCQIIRSAVRKSWMRHPTKLLKLDLATVPDMDDSTRTKWLVHCEECGNTFKKADVEVDHIKGEHKLKKLEDAPAFAESILRVGLDDLRILCKPCHEVKTYQERNNVDQDIAIASLKAIAFEKKHNASEIKSFLLTNGFSQQEVNNKDTRRTSLISHFS